MDRTLAAAVHFLIWVRLHCQAGMIIGFVRTGKRFTRTHMEVHFVPSELLDGILGSWVLGLGGSMLPNSAVTSRRQNVGHAVLLTQ